MGTWMQVIELGAADWRRELVRAEALDQHPDGDHVVAVTYTAPLGSTRVGQRVTVTVEVS